METFREKYLQHFGGQFGGEIYEKFIKATTVHRDDSGTLLINAPNEATLRWLKANLDKPLRELAHEYFSDGIKIQYTTRPSATTQPERREGETPPLRPTSLRNDLTFDGFVCGRANEIALMASRSLAEGNKDYANPLFLYGSTGLGKTHLAQAIGNHYLKKHSNHRVLYLTARDFMKRVVHAYRFNQQDRFNERFNNLDMLIVDDIQYIGGDKKRTQEEFFFLFNQLYDQQKIIVITCDKAPAQINEMPQRLTSRFLHGLTTYLAPPELELREAIIRQKATAYNITLNEEVAHLIAEKVKSNVRELTGALKRVLAAADFCNKEPSIEICRQVLPDLISTNTGTAVNAVLIQKKTAAFFHVKITDLVGAKRFKNITMARQVAMFLCRQLTTMSLPEIGAQFDNRNHTTVLHACRKIEEKMCIDGNIRENIRILEMLIKS